MRDYVVTLIVFASLPLILRKPFLGILVWTWLGLMNPHRLCWGFATGLPFAQMVAIATLVGLLISKEAKSMPWVTLTRLLLFWWLWMLTTTVFALLPGSAWEQWDKVWKIMLLTFVAILLLDTRERLHALVWIVVISLGFYGVKGGIFTLTSGGGEKVWGPSGTFIGGNNEIGLALIMTVPLMRYIQLASASTLVKNGMLAAMGLTVMAILGTQSRGALVGGAAMILYLTLKSRNRARLLLLLALLLPAAILFMPETWFSRMETIETYQQDASALGRINAWWTAFYIALDRPLVGGGFDVVSAWTFAKYAPDPAAVHDFHSIYFEVLGEQGFVGLGLFLSIGAVSMASLGRVIAFAKTRRELLWMRDMASMVQVSLIGYAVSGAFLGLAYFDYYYTLVAIAIGLVRVKNQYALQGVPSPSAASGEAAMAANGPRPQGIGPRPPRRFGAPKKPLFGFDIRGWYAKL